MTTEQRKEFIEGWIAKVPKTDIYAGITWMPTEDDNNAAVSYTKPDPRDEEYLGMMDTLEHLSRGSIPFHIYFENAYRYPTLGVDSISIPIPTTDYMFATGLHELGHLLGGGKLGATTSELEAAYWAVDNAPYWNSEMTRNVMEGINTYTESKDTGLTMPKELASKLHSYLVSKEQ